MSKVKSTYKFVFYPLATLLSIITLLIIIQPSGMYYRVFTNSAVQIMLGILGFGLLCLLLQWHRLMFVAFTCTGILCLFLKSSSNPSPAYATPNVKEDIEVIHLNISNFNGEEYEELTDLLLESGADLISIQEVKPDWDTVLREELLDSFPYFSSMPNIGINGMAVFSKYPISDLDTFYYSDIPNLTGLIHPEDNKPIRFISTYTNPAFGTDKFYKELKDHFEMIIDKVEDSSEARLAFGTYNTVAWSSEMKFFTGALGLQNSRRSISPFSQSTYEHIFHSMDMECVSFDGLYDVAGEKIGLKVKLHIKNISTSYYDKEPTK
ncbi:MAG: hypothetical protein ACI94Y_003147 [Maribacter sp.]|jgi:hypothetical protein